MISIIICSRMPDISIELKTNISETIGVEYEIIVIDNSTNKYSIFSAYNEGVKKAQFLYLCFMHEDVLYHTKDWGKIVIEHFKRENVGLIGVVGCHFLPKTESYWCDTDLISGRLIQGWTENGVYKTKNIYHSTYIDGKKSIEAVAVDGMWFMIPKKLFEIIRFDDNLFTGFHFYEMDICMQVLNSDYQVRIINDLLLEHFSYGNIDKLFYKARSLFYKKWRKSLPLLKGIVLSEKIIAEENQKIKQFRSKEKKSYQCQKKIKNLMKVSFLKIKSLT